MANAVPSYGKDHRFESDRFYQSMSLSSNGRTLIKGYPVKDTVSILKIPCQGRDLGSNPSNDTILCVNAETVDSPTAVGAKGSSPLGVRKTLSMVLLVVRIHLHTPSFEIDVEIESPVR